MKKFILPVLFSGILSVSAGEKITVKPGYENPYTANITRFVPSPLILLGQYKKAYSFCEKQLKELPADSQSLQVLSCWKNMVHALKALQQNEKLEPLRRDLLNRFPRNIPFLAGLDLESIPPYGYWLDHTFYRGEPADTFLPVFSKLKEDRKILLRYLTDPITVKMAQQVSDPELKKLYFLNLRKILLTGNETLSSRELTLLHICNDLLRKVPLDKKSLFIKIPKGNDLPITGTQCFNSNFHSTLLAVFANNNSASFAQLKQYRLPSGGYGLLPDITESAHPLLTAWGCEATQFLGRIMNDPSALPDTKDTTSILTKFLAERLYLINSGKDMWNDNDAFIACAVSHLGQPATVLRMYQVRQKLSPFAKIMLARSLPVQLEEYRVICDELKALKTNDAKTLAALLAFLRERFPADPRIPILKKQVAATPFSLWKARALYGEKVAQEKLIPSGLTIKADPQNGKLELHVKQDLHFLRIGFSRHDIPASIPVFRTYENQTKAIHREIKAKWEFLLFCTLPAGKHVIPLPSFAPGTITAECYRF